MQVRSESGFALLHDGLRMHVVHGDDPRHMALEFLGGNAGGVPVRPDLEM